MCRDLGVVLDEACGVSADIDWKDVGRSGVERFCGPVEVDASEEAPVAELLACLTAVLGVERRTSSMSASSSSSSSTMAPAMERCFPAEAGSNPAFLFVVADEDEGAPFAPFARDRKITLDPAVSSFSSPMSKAEMALRGFVDAEEVLAAEPLLVGLIELCDGPASTSSTSS